MTNITPRVSYSPLGRQPFRPGQWQGYKGVSRNTTYIQNNFFGSSYNSGMNYGNYNTCHNYGCNEPSKFAKWMMGIGIGSALLGSILNMFGIGNKKDDDISVKESLKKEIKTEIPEEENEEEDTEIDESEEEQPIDEPPAEIDTLSVKKEEVKTTTNYKVNYGDTWANIITAKYKDENGNPISYADAKELWTKLKEECGVSKSADGMPANIELPNEFKNYKLDINGKVTANTAFNTLNYKKYDGSGFTPKTTTNYTATGTINGKPIGTVSGNQEEVTAQLKAKGFAEKDINDAIKNGEVKITKQKEE